MPLRLSISQHLPYPPVATTLVRTSLFLAIAMLTLVATASASTPDHSVKRRTTVSQRARYSPKKKPVRAVPPKALPAQSTTIETADVRMNANGEIQLRRLPQFRSTLAGHIAGVTPGNDFVYYTLDPDLQHYAESIVNRSRLPNAAVVVMDPQTGRLLALAERSSSVENLLVHADLPAASLFKVVTTAAGLEQGIIHPDSLVAFRGSNYTLERWNYLPDKRRDRRRMSVREALGKSVNPVFGRIGLALLRGPLNEAARRFGFNAPLGSDLPLPVSSATIPTDQYELSRTAAGFGKVKISPVHAATLVSGLANGGVLPRPFLIDRVLKNDGSIIYQADPRPLSRITDPRTARTVLDMMVSTTTSGTSRREFAYNRGSTLRGVRVAGKTGTLHGDLPRGVNNWFIGTAPLDKPVVAVSVIVVNPGGASTRASRFGRLLLEEYFRQQKRR